MSILKASVGLVVIALLVFIYQSCGRAKVGDESTAAPRKFYVDSVSLAPESDPKTNAIIKVQGNFADGCGAIKSMEVSKRGHQIEVEVITVETDPDMMCTAALEPFSQDVELGALAPGQHHVRVTDGRGEFQEVIVNVPQ